MSEQKEVSVQTTEVQEPLLSCIVTKFGDIECPHCNLELYTPVDAELVSEAHTQHCPLCENSFSVSLEDIKKANALHTEYVVRFQTEELCIIEGQPATHLREGTKAYQLAKDRGQLSEYDLNR